MIALGLAWLGLAWLGLNQPTNQPTNQATKQASEGKRQQGRQKGKVNLNTSAYGLPKAKVKPATFAVHF